MEESPPGPVAWSGEAITSPVPSAFRFASKYLMTCAFIHHYQFNFWLESNRYVQQLRFRPTPFQKRLLTHNNVLHLCYKHATSYLLDLCVREGNLGVSSKLAGLHFLVTEEAPRQILRIGIHGRPAAASSSARAFIHPAALLWAIRRHLEGAWPCP